MREYVEPGTARAYAYLPTSNEAIKATNELLSRGVRVLIARTPFTDSGRSFGTGTFIIPLDSSSIRSIVNELANKYGLSLFALKSIPKDALQLRMPRIVVHADAGLRFVLGELGFNFTIVTTSDLNNGIDLSGYDLFIHSRWSLLWGDLTDTGRATLREFFNRGGNYIGVGRSGVDLATRYGLLDVSYKTGLSSDNGIIKIEISTADPITAQYPGERLRLRLWTCLVYTSWCRCKGIRSYIYRRILRLRHVESLEGKRCRKYAGYSSRN